MQHNVRDACTTGPQYGCHDQPHTRIWDTWSICERAMHCQCRSALCCHPVVDSGSREIRAGKVHIYQLEVKMTGAVMLYTAFYNFSQAVWGLMAPTILPVHTVGYHWQHESTNRVSVLSLFMHTRAALSIFSLLLWGVCWSFLWPTSRSPESANPPRQNHFWKKKTTFRRQKKLHLRQEPLVPLQKWVWSMERAWACPTLPGAASLKILWTVTTTSLGLWKKF